jgi:hypothetical protein
MNKLLKVSVSAGALCFALSSCGSSEPLTREEQFLKSISGAHPDFVEQSGESVVLELADLVCLNEKNGTVSSEELKVMFSDAVFPEIANDVVDIALAEYC